MYYKIRNKILFRQYGHYGYITDNSEFGFRLLNDTNIQLGETFVSEVGSIMLSKLSKNPREIDDIIDDLMEIFQNVERKTVKADTMEFFQQFVNQGYLSAGASPETCLDQNQPFSSTATETDKKKITSSEEEGSIPPIGPNDFLRSIHFDVASACNEHCVHCYVPDRCKTKTIESKLFFQVLQEARDLNAIHVTLSGGEPLLHKDLTAFLERSRELDLPVNVLSNLTLLTDDIIAEMKRNPLLSVQTSLYSMDAQTHDSITGLPGSFEKTVSGVLRVSSAGIPVQISCPIMKQNVDSFFDVVVWGKRQNIAVAVEPMIFASYDHSRNNVQNRISPIQFKNILDQKMSENYAATLREVAMEKESLTEDDPICSVCRYSLCVSVDGDVFPCAGWQSNAIGNLNQCTLKEIWETSEEVKHLRSIKRRDFPKCVDCEDRGYCTVCMMANSNENPNGNPFLIDNFRCQVAAMTHRKVIDLLQDAAHNESEISAELQ